MKITYCDRCKTEITGENYFPRFSGTDESERIVISHEKANNKEKYSDLCNRCLFRNILKVLAGKNPAAFEKAQEDFRNNVGERLNAD